jgi:hypothetical protein
MRFEMGDYGRDLAGEWWARAPGAKAAGALTDHSVTEHDDGTITVEPSILAHDGSYHGYLRRGEWTDA